MALGVQKLSGGIRLTTASNEKITGVRYRLAGAATWTPTTGFTNVGEVNTYDITGNIDEVQAELEVTKQELRSVLVPGRTVPAHTTKSSTTSTGTGTGSSVSAARSAALNNAPDPDDPIDCLSNDYTSTISDSYSYNTTFVTTPGEEQERSRQRLRSVVYCRDTDGNEGPIYGSYGAWGAWGAWNIRDGVSHSPTPPSPPPAPSCPDGSQQVRAGTDVNWVFQYRTLPPTTTYTSTVTITRTRTCYRASYYVPSRYEDRLVTFTVAETSSVLSILFPATLSAITPTVASLRLQVSPAVFPRPISAPFPTNGAVPLGINLPKDGRFIIYRETICLDTPSGGYNGLAVDDDFFYVSLGNRIRLFNRDGSFSRAIDNNNAANRNTVGLTLWEDNIYAMDASDRKAYVYNKLSGGESPSINLNPPGTSVAGAITRDKDYFWTTDTYTPYEIHQFTPYGSHVRSVTTGQQGMSGIANREDYLYYVRQYGYLYVVNKSDLSPVANYRLPSPRPSSPDGMYVYKNTMYILENSNSCIYVYDMSVGDVNIDVPTINTPSISIDSVVVGINGRVPITNRPIDTDVTSARHFDPEQLFPGQLITKEYLLNLFEALNIIRSAAQGAPPHSVGVGQGRPGAGAVQLEDQAFITFDGAEMITVNVPQEGEWVLNINAQGSPEWITKESFINRHSVAKAIATGLS